MHESNLSIFALLFAFLILLAAFAVAGISFFGIVYSDGVRSRAAEYSKALIPEELRSNIAQSTPAHNGLGVDPVAGITQGFYPAGWGAYGVWGWPLADDIFASNSTDNQTLEVLRPLSTMQPVATLDSLYTSAGFRSVVTGANIAGIGSDYMSCSQLNDKLTIDCASDSEGVDDVVIGGAKIKF